MEMIYEMRFVQALVLTILIEAGVLLAAVRWLFHVHQDTLPTWRVLAAAVACTALTLPYVWFLLPILGLSGPTSLLAAEVFAITVEAALLVGLLRFQPKAALVASLLCNTFSALAGSFLFA